MEARESSAIIVHYWDQLEVDRTVRLAGGETREDPSEARVVYEDERQSGTKM